MCVVQEGETWKVYYVERDKPKELATSPSEEESYDFLYSEFSSWAGK
jgi:hypothetical protein